jgi:pimeloyl-ACP methyl ester carboxylesterase
MWAPLIDLLAAEREVIAVDMPGFGRSPAPPGVALSARNLARLTLEFYDTLGLEGSPHVAGISLGAWVAIEFARLGRARSVTGLCSAGFWRQPAGPGRGRAREAARALLPIAPLLFRSARLRRLALSAQMRHPERVSRAEAVDLVRSYALSPGYPEANELMRAGVVGDISELGAPVTLAWAEFDTLVRRTPLRSLPEQVTQVVLPDCGHLPSWDAPELVARLILEG